MALFKVGCTSPFSIRGCVGAMSRHQVSQSLYQHPAAENIGQTGNVFTISNRLMEGFGKIRADQNGKVSISGAPIGIAMPVDGHYRVGTAGIFHGHFTAGTHAEGADAVVKTLVKSTPAWLHKGHRSSCP